MADTASEQIAIEVRPPAPARSDRRLLWFVVLNILAANVGIKLIAHFLFHTGVDEMRIRYKHFFTFWQFTDSWGPMLGSVNYYLAHPNLPIYQAKLYDTLIYPLTSILPLLWMKRAGMSDTAVYRALMIASWLAVWAVVGLAVAIAASVLRRHHERLSWQAGAATALGAFFFMPITLAFSLGQAQIFLDVLFAALVLFWVNRMERSAGVTMALMAMIKPQFGLLLLWAALRRKWSAVASGAIALAVGATASIAAFGLRNNLDYLRVLSGLSRKAQSHYANQSMFGLLNRAIFNGENLPYHPYVYPPFVPWVYYVTLATTAALILLALAYPWRQRAGSTADLGAIGVLCVIATPMTWEHHYGVMLGIFVWLWFAVYRQGHGRPIWLAISWILIADFLSFFNYFAPMPVLNVLQSYMYFGALLLLGLLLKSETTAIPLGGTMSSERTRLSFALVATAAFLVLAPGTVAVYVPWRITHWHVQHTLPLSPMLQAGGAILVLLGSATLIASFLRFAIQGLGTPAPPFPTRKLIVSGLYRYVRNPMYVAVIAVILGQALAFGSMRLAAYAACVWLTMHLFVLLYEEPKLRKTFGAEYEGYLFAVPRWIPAIKRAKPNGL